MAADPLSYVDRVYTEIGKFLSREFQDNIDGFRAEDRTQAKVSRSRAALSMAVLTHLFTAAVAMLIGFAVFGERGWNIDAVLEAALA